MYTKIGEILKNIVCRTISFYQYWISILLPQSRCIYQPSCSSYAQQAIQKHGVIKGSYLGIKRILSCHPGSSGGKDPVPD